MVDAPNTNPPPVCVTLSALDAGHLTLPERLFVTDADPEKRSTVPSLSFLIQHPSTTTHSGKQTSVVFDLGLKRDLAGYPPVQQAHIAARQPIISHPDCADSLRHGTNYDNNPEDKKEEGITTKKEDVLLDPATDIDAVILSHVHWDHVGTPADFAAATFVVGAGTLDLLKNGAGPLYPAEIFNDDELPASRTVELPPVTRGGGSGRDNSETDSYDTGPHVPNYTPASAETRNKLAAPVSSTDLDRWSWMPLGSFPHTLDFFGDGSLYVVDSPGHLYGHVNLLARVGAHRYIYLGGDCCHDPRILSGEKGIALYDDGRGGQRSVHVHTGVARRTLDQIEAFVTGMREKESGDDNDVEVEVEVVVAHDGIWRAKNRHRFWPGKM